MLESKTTTKKTTNSVAYGKNKILFKSLICLPK